MICVKKFIKDGSGMARGLVRYALSRFLFFNRFESSYNDIKMILCDFEGIGF